MRCPRPTPTRPRNCSPASPRGWATAPTTSACRSILCARAARARSDGGLGLSPYVIAATDTKIALSEALSLEVAASTDIETGLALLLRAGQDPQLLTGLLDSPGSEHRRFQACPDAALRRPGWRTPAADFGRRHQLRRRGAARGHCLRRRHRARPNAFRRHRRRPHRDQARPGRRLPRLAAARLGRDRHGHARPRLVAPLRPAHPRRRRLADHAHGASALRPAATRCDRPRDRRRRRWADHARAVERRGHARPGNRGRQRRGRGTGAALYPRQPRRRWTSAPISCRHRASVSRSRCPACSKAAACCSATPCNPCTPACCNSRCTR